MATYPTDIPGIGYRLDGSNLGALGAPIAAWTDLAGLIADHTQATASAQPVVVDGPNGTKAAGFDGVNDTLASVGAAQKITRNVPGVTMIAVARLDVVTAGATREMIHFTRGASTTSNVGRATLQHAGAQTVTNGTVVPDGALGMSVRRVDTDAVYNTASTTPTTSGQWAVFTGIIDYANGTTKVMRNGQVVATATLPSAGLTSDTDARIVSLGANSGTPGNFHAGPIAMAVTYRRALSDAEVARIHSYVQDAYTIPVADYVAPIPAVNAGADTAVFTGGTLTRTAAEFTPSPITARSWTIVSGPAGVGTVLSSSADLSWSPTVVGTYTLRYSATNAAGVGTDDVVVALKTVSVTFADFPTDGQAVSAHHGGGNNPYLAFDGSMSAFKLAVDGLGAKMLDLDMQATKDNVLVAMHDTTVDRTTRGTGLVSAFNYIDLPLLDMRQSSGEGWSPEPVPTIDAVLSEFGGRVHVTIEPKDTTDVVPLINMLKAKGLADAVFLNCNQSRTADIQTIAASGIKAHVWGATTQAQVDTANANGAWLVELPASAGKALVDYARARSSIERVMCAPISTLNDRDLAEAAGFDAYVSDTLGYLSRSPRNTAQRTSIAAEIAARKVGQGWRRIWQQGWSVTSPPSTPQAFGLFSGGGVVLSDGTYVRRLSLGSINGARAGSGSITFRAIHSSGSTTTARSDYRVMVPREEGDGTDADSRGYVIGLRRSGEVVMWTSPAAFGAGISLGTVQTAAVGTTEVTVLRFSWTPTTVTLERLDAAGNVLGAIGPVLNSDWRGPDVMVAAAAGTNPTGLILTGVDVATAGVRQRVRSGGAWVDTTPKVLVGGAWVSDASRVMQGGGWI